MGLACHTGVQAHEKNVGRVGVVNPQARSSLVPQPVRANLLARIKKKFALVYISYFFMDSYINVPNSCITGKDKYNVFFNMLKFKEYIIYIIL